MSGSEGSSVWTIERHFGSCSTLGEGSTTPLASMSRHTTVAFQNISIYKQWRLFINGCNQSLRWWRRLFRSHSSGKGRLTGICRAWMKMELCWEFSTAFNHQHKIMEYFFLMMPQSSWREIGASSHTIRSVNWICYVFYGLIRHMNLWHDSFSSGLGLQSREPLSKRISNDYLVSCGERLLPILLALSASW